MSLLNNYNIIITGGSTGIGFAIAKACAHAGATVVIAARGEKDLDFALKELRDISSSCHGSYRVDVSDSTQVIEFAKWYQEQYQEVHGLVNCAAIYGPIGNTLDINLAEFQKTFQVNFMGTFFVCKAFAPLFGSKKRKKIIAFSGGGASSTFPFYSAYACSKVAVVRLVENLAVELINQNFDINAIAPGFVKTRLHQQTLAAGPSRSGLQFFEKTKKEIESGGVPVEKAVGLTLFLLSERSDGITGKFLSAPWDSWQNEEFQKRLRLDSDLATIRRIDDMAFLKSEVSNC